MRPGRYAAVLAAFGCQRLAELAYSARNERRIRARSRIAPQAAASSYKWIVLTNTALFLLPALERVLRRRSHVPAAAIAIGWMAALGGTALRLSVLASLGPAWTARALVPTDLQVIDRGPYRLIRHPNYLALGLEFIGLPLIGGAYYSAAGLSLLNAGLLATRIREEESLLMAIPEYRLRMADKPRFLPRLTNR
ncbi:MAG TPA: isoprenylcysteine carboxylmethyltransferase family protein [Candidatus Dormibacteraeota bacterium]|nr:isoprenylcysteine carboxylmethyltransferase family protein [Candidatus Dormibacteraeota bacterium]